MASAIQSKFSKGKGDRSVSYLISTDEPTQTLKAGSSLSYIRIALICKSIEDDRSLGPCCSEWSEKLLLLGAENVLQYLHALRREIIAVRTLPN